MREGQSDVPASAVISNSFTLKYSICRCAVFWGGMCGSPSLDISHNFVIVTNYSHFYFRRREEGKEDGEKLPFLCSDYPS